MSKVIMTTYYTGKPNPQRTAKEAVPNDFSMIEEWYNSVVRLGLQGIILHDHLVDEFVKKYQCENVQFIRVPYLSERTLNDERYYVYLREMVQNPEIEWALFTDLFDVEFNKDPFEFTTNTNVLYVGSEPRDTAHYSDDGKVCWPVIGNKARQAYGKVPSWWPLVIKHLLNAGVIGGHRGIIMRLLNLMIQDFDKIDISLDTNMFVLAKCIFENDIPFCTGPPLHSPYKKYDKSDEFYIRHK